jgi:hypothetical protein
MVLPCTIWLLLHISKKIHGQVFVQPFCHLLIA